MPETIEPAAVPLARPVACAAPAREVYIDSLRSAMTALVILHHTAITYGASGDWFWNELRPSAAPSSLLLTLFVATNQAYFMGFFFLLAGYFTPASLERKGWLRFLGDRNLRLGLPLLVFIFALGPLTAAMVNRFADGGGFWGTFVWLWNHGTIINGPLWFAEALLVFSAGYCTWRALLGAPLQQAVRTPKPIPSFGWWLLSAVGVGAGALTIRQAVPVGVNIIGLQLGYFSSYLFLFSLGVAAWRFDWLRQLQWKHARPWLRVLGIAMISMPLVLAVADKTRGSGKSNFAGGLSVEAIFYAFWEPFVAWGLIAAWLLVFRATMNRPSAFWTWLNRRAYAVYILHPPVLVGVALLLHPWVAPALLKFAVVGALSCAATWIVADPLVRIPGVRRVV